QVGGQLAMPPSLAITNPTASSTVVVGVNMTSPDPANSGGLVTISIGINYDPARFTVATADVVPGPVLTAAGVDPGWASGFGANTSTPGRIDILANGPAITNTAGGDIVRVTFHLKATGTASGVSVINLANSGTQ